MNTAGIDIERAVRRLNPELRSRMYQRMTRAQKPVMTVFAVIMVGSILAFGLRGTSLVPLAFFGVWISLVLVWWALSWPRKIQKELDTLYDKFAIELTSDAITRRQPKLNDLTIPFAHIQKAELHAGRYLIITGEKRSEKIGIPVEIEDFDGVVQVIQNYCPVTDGKVNPVSKQLTISAALMICFFAALWTEVPTVAVPLIIIAIIGMIWMFVYIRTNPNCPRRTRRVASFYLVLMIPLLLKLLALYDRTLK